jgi:sigma-B regulation protein RsbU (phosphoserine phosphatase)
MMMEGWESGVRSPARLGALDESGLAGTGPEDAFDRLIELALALIDVPRAAITLVDAKHTAAKACLGFRGEGLWVVPVEQSFCRYVVGFGRPLIVVDAREDPRTVGDPAITIYGAVAWAGYGIEGAGGAILGTFCLMDSRPHEWTPRDLHVLATLAKAASSEVQLRTAMWEVWRARKEIECLRSALAAGRAGVS